MVNNNLKNVIRQRMERTAEALRNNCMDAYIVADEKEAKAKVEELLFENATIGVGGSATLDECGILELIKDKKYRFIDRYESGISGDEVKRRHIAALGADVYISGTNAVTENGELYNVDGNGNRIAAIAFGPDSVIIVAGYNKIVKDLDDAVKRVKMIAAPANTKRLSCNSYCKEFGECKALAKGEGGMTDGCMTDGRICCDYLILARQRKHGRIKVILVEKELGF